jgi:hypothetical protein
MTNQSLHQFHQFAHDKLNFLVDKLKLVSDLGRDMNETYKSFCNSVDIVLRIKRDSHGFLWFCTRDGQLRYARGSGADRSVQRRGEFWVALQDTDQIIRF